MGKTTLIIVHCQHRVKKLKTHTHPFNGPFSGTTRVSQYQKGKTNLDFTEARDTEWQWHQLGHMQVCISLQTDNHTSTPPLSFLQAGCPSCHPTNSVKANRKQHHINEYAHTRSTALFRDYPTEPVPERYNQSGFYWSKRQWVAVASAGHMQACTLLQTDNHASTPPLSFLQAGCPSCHPTNSVKALKVH